MTATRIYKSDLKKFNYGHDINTKDFATRLNLNNSVMFYAQKTFLALYYCSKIL